MFPELKIKNANNVAWLPDSCVAAYFNFFVIGKLNESGYFSKNKYLKFRFVDFENFLLICLRTLTFFSWDPLLSKEEDLILETSSYKISLQGKFEKELKKKQIFIKATFSATLFYELDFDKKEFDLLMSAFLKISVDVFCCCPQSKSVMRVFFEKISENSLNIKDYSPEIYLESFEQKDYLKLCLEICDSLQIDNLNSYFIFDQIILYKHDLLTITKIKSWLESSLALDIIEKNKESDEAKKDSLDTQALSVGTYSVDSQGFCQQNGSCNNNSSFVTEES